MLIGCKLLVSANKDGLIVETEQGRKLRWQELRRHLIEGYPYSQEERDKLFPPEIPIAASSVQVTIKPDGLVMAVVEVPVAVLDLEGIEWRLKEGSMETELYGKKFKLVEVQEEAQ